ncbi:hypothetical protein LEP1GSC172_3833 [Leptospira noguchii]|uniref:Uncharacterized protein n=2 Tax=Leptospira noguchii TaxID=28182 RepID=T0GV35_9LEPT|nr:hypothetical protein LEP1GSC172_3833 [Leptospira noguchii]EQA72792.1 hypothetical protein LEP1GSC059_2467 [Leptospira noguchii serovar Panama str. CZ214]
MKQFYESSLWNFSTTLLNRINKTTLLIIDTFFQKLHLYTVHS